MENNFEKMQSRAHCVAQVDMLYLVLQTIIFIAWISLKFLHGIYDTTSGELVVFHTSNVIIVVTTIIQYYATTMLLTSSNKENNVNADKALSCARFWYKLTFGLLVIVILMSLFVILPIGRNFNFNAVIIVGVIISIRVYMLWTVKPYMEALEVRVAETGTNNGENSITRGPEWNEFQVDDV